MAIKAGAPKLKTKTIDAIIDHITQTLPQDNGEYFPGLAQYYLKALSFVFEHKPNVERLQTSSWIDVVMFCLNGINNYIEAVEAEPLGLSRSFSGLGTGHTPGSLPKSSLGSGNSQNKSGFVSRQNVEDLLTTLLPLVSTPNAPLLERSKDIVTSVVRMLRLQPSAVSAVHQLAFSILNAVLFCCREDRSSLLQNVAQESIPIISRFWQGRITAHDQMLNSVRDETLILLFTCQLHLERSLMDETTPDLALNVVDLLNVMRVEYSKRSDRDQLQLENLEILNLGDSPREVTPFRLRAFCLRPNDIRGERNWAILQALGLLERLVSLEDKRKKPDLPATENNLEKHPRKRQRISQAGDRLVDPLKSEDESVRLAGLQVLPFILHEFQLSASALEEVIEQLINCTADKRGNIASWAFLAIAR